MNSFTISNLKNADTATVSNKIEEACDYMQKVFDDGFYPKVSVFRQWSEHNPTIDGEFARPSAYRWYLKRELSKLALTGAEITITKSRPRLPLNSPELLNKVDEEEWDFTQKKLFLFQAERIELSLDRLEHYTGTSANDFQRYIMFTNYDMHVEVFQEKYPDCVKPNRKVQMPAYHHKLDDNMGFTLVNIGVGPSNAKTCSDHIAVLRPDAMVMVGHCGGLRNHQEIGDFVLASGHMRDDRLLDEIVPLNIPIIPTNMLNMFLMDELAKREINYRVGTVYTTANRNWEFAITQTVKQFHLSRSIAIDMESATLATNGFRYRVPHATLLCVSDKPLHGKPKLTGAAQSFYQNSKQAHLEIVIAAYERIKETHKSGLPNASIRSTNEPLLGGPE